VTVLDAQALLGYLLREPAAAVVRALLGGPAAISAVNAAEVIDILLRRGHVDPDQSTSDLALLQVTGLAVVPAGLDTASRAARIRATRYHRTRSPLSLADSFAAATALTRQEPLATADRALAAAGRAEGGAVIDLPDSAGRRPRHGRP
jgi:PIN domain nuclease of toxin-antitoxin system